MGDVCSETDWFPSCTKGCPQTARENSHMNPDILKKDAFGGDRVVAMLQNKRCCNYQLICNNSSNTKVKVSNPDSIWWENCSNAGRKGKCLVSLGHWWPWGYCGDGASKNWESEKDSLARTASIQYIFRNEGITEAMCTISGNNTSSHLLTTN